MQNRSNALAFLASSLAFAAAAAAKPRNAAVAIMGGLGAMVGTAHAALPEGAAAAITTYETDVVAVFALLISAGIAIFAIRKLGQKMGWL